MHETSVSQRTSAARSQAQTSLAIATALTLFRKQPLLAAGLAVGLGAALGLMRKSATAIAPDGVHDGSERKADDRRQSRRAGIRPSPNCPSPCRGYARSGSSRSRASPARRQAGRRPPSRSYARPGGHPHRRCAPSTTTLPFGTEREPYFAALVASSCRTSPRPTAWSGPSKISSLWISICRP